MKQITTIILAFIFFFSCSQITGEKGTVTDKQVENYLKAYKKLREKAPDILQVINENNDQTKAGKEGYNTVEEIIKESGIESYAEFVRLNAKIGSVFSILQAYRGMDQQANLQESGQDMFDDSYRFVEEQLNDPEVPEETKVELRKTLEELKKDLKETYESNKVIADWVMGKTESGSMLFIVGEFIFIIFELFR